jgi:hypothetical protein
MEECGEKNRAIPRTADKSCEGLRLSGGGGRRDVSMSGLWPWDANADGASYGSRLDETQ